MSMTDDELLWLVRQGLRGTWEHIERAKRALEESEAALQRIRAQEVRERLLLTRRYRR